MKLKLRSDYFPSEIVEEEEYEEVEISYRDGGEGFGAWCDDFVCVPIVPPGSKISVWTPLGNLPDEKHVKTGKSYHDLWAEQKEIMNEALRMSNGEFIYRLIILCWMRGEGKSLLACLIQMWKFFNWPRQLITLGANSKDQVQFVHFDIMRDFIRNSPLLYDIVGERNIKVKEIVLTDTKGHIRSMIKPISSFSGIVSNITGYTFSEIFDMKNPKFFVQLDGSIRNIPNALGVIDSTVSEKTHVLYKLYNGFIKHESKTVFFSYRHSKGPNGKMEDFWNPMMDQIQLDDYKSKFPFGEFERYFLNLWSAGFQQVFSDVMIDETKYVGCDNVIGNHEALVGILEKKDKMIKSAEDTKGKGLVEGAEEVYSNITTMMERCNPVSDLYTLSDGWNPTAVTMDELNKLTETYDTDWAILSGVDFGDPYAIRGYARSILTVVAKGLPGSKSTPSLGFLNEKASKYIYILLYITNIEDHSLDSVKNELDELHNEYDGLDTFCSERFGAWDVGTWCIDRDITFEPIFPTYARQKEAFKEVLIATKEGRFKAPPIPIAGSKTDDILREEFSVFMHDSDKRWFGSPEKMEKHGIQDDSIFSLGWGFYGGRLLSVADFRPRRSLTSFGMMYKNNDLVGSYR